MRKFIARARLRYVNCPARDNDSFAWLSLARHHGLPTRLLDWTESIVVAAYFALVGKPKDHPPAVWALDPCKLNAYALNKSTVWHRAGMGGPLAPGHKDVKILAEDALSAQVDTTAEHRQMALAVIAPETDLRMLVQHAAFTIHGKYDPLQTGRVAAECLMKFEIDGGCREQLHNRLISVHVREDALFPDLDRLAQGIADAEPLPEPVRR